MNEHSQRAWSVKVEEEEEEEEETYLFSHWKRPIKESCHDVLGSFDLCLIKFEIYFKHFLKRLNVPPLQYTKACHQTSSSIVS
jgi:hypothetical protein